ncbi:hypothetical protein [Tomitella gaofuii]|uniref:hypothetical protein n=1 Tax=Tomitella gaofuii TaxID=2760083 RepID=UPI0015FCE5CA|nr:hypothetical protein [Tomitella gaofuii]
MTAVLGGCSGSGQSTSASGSVTMLRTSTPLREPIWSSHVGRLLGVTPDGRVASVAVTGDHPGDTMLSEPLGEADEVAAGGKTAGENLAINPLDDSTVFIAMPAQGRIAELRIGGLRPVGSLPGGPAPDTLAVEAGAGILLAMPADGSSVAVIDLHLRKLEGVQPVDAGPGGGLSGAGRGRTIDFHVTGRGGVSHYKSHTMPAEESGTVPVAAQAIAGDRTKSSRVYVAERDTERLLALDTKRTLTGLEEVGHAELGAPGRYIGTDNTRVYAATETALVVLEANSFEGFPRDGAIPHVRTIDFRQSLDGAARTAPLSGLAVGPDRIYLTLEGVSGVVSIAKPQL